MPYLPLADCTFQLWIDGKTLFQFVHFSSLPSVCPTEMSEEVYIKVICMNFVGWQFPPRRGNSHEDHCRGIFFCALLWAVADRVSLSWSPRAFWWSDTVKFSSVLPWSSSPLLGSTLLSLEVIHVHVKTYIRLPFPPQQHCRTLGWRQVLWWRVSFPQWGALLPQTNIWRRWSWQSHPKWGQGGRHRMNRCCTVDFFILTCHTCACGVDAITSVDVTICH